ncbi:MAG: helix-turn-helix transcriptional regulator [Lachnospiraceae bacterium]
MLQYKIDVISELAKVGINTTTAKKSGIFGQDTMRKFRNGDTKISLEVLNRLCCVLEMQPRDIIKFVETEEDREKIISKICEKPIDNHINM